MTLKADSAGRTLFSKVVPLLLVAFAIWLAFVRAAPHLHEPIWQDEAATLLFHVSDAPWSAFLSYESPNSHVGFTAMLSAWIAAHTSNMDVVALRTLPLVLSLAAVPASFFAGRKLAGAWAGVLAAILLAQSVVTENFSTQLRGYGPSWLFLALALLAALHLFDSRRRHRAAWLCTYFLAALVAVSILPTNAFYIGVIGLCVSAHTWQFSGARREALLSHVVLLATPAVSLVVAYAAVLPQLASYSAVDFSDWSRWELLQNWSRGTLGDERLLVPLIGAGIVVQLTTLALRMRQGAAGPPVDCLATLLLLALPVAVLLMPSPPFPRTLTPYLPVWYIAIAAAMATGVQALFNTSTRPVALAGVVLGSLALLSTGPVARCRSAQGSGEYEYDLCYQYFRDRYDPGAVVQLWESLERPDVPIVSEFEGQRAIGVLGSEAAVFNARGFQASDHPPPVIVAYDDAGARRALELIGSRTPYRIAADTGYFNVYLPVPAASPK